MILRFLRRAQWEERLRKLGAEPLAGKGKLNSAEWWRIPGQPPFTVPIEDESGKADFWAIQKLAAQLGSGERVFKTWPDDGTDSDPTEDEEDDD